MNKLQTLTIVSALFILRSAFGQGTLTPPGAPAPTMKTLTQIEPRTAISSLPYTISNPGSYYFTGNLTNPGVGNGITVSSPNVTIDLNGFTLQGIPTSSDGIYVNGSFTNLVFRNGTVTGWGGNGINTWSGGYPRNVLFDHLTLSANSQHGIYAEAGSVMRNCIAIVNGNSGFYCQGGEIIDCLARQNNSSGFTTSGGFTVYNSSLVHCDAQYNTYCGIYLSSSRALDCDCIYTTGNGVVCAGAGDQVSRCRICFNGGVGLYFDSGNGENLIENCLVANNSAYGLDTGAGSAGGSTITGNTFNLNSGGAMIIGESNDYIENNHAVITAGDSGIEVTSSGYTNIVVVKNVVVGGGANNYLNISGVNDFGPIGAASSATSPWANISH